MEYILVSLDHRQTDPHQPNYESFKDYYQRMKTEHGLVHVPFYTFKKNKKWARCFAVEDEVKALEFVFKFSEYTEKPET